MKQFGKELRMYADNGLRSAAEWFELGRKVEDGSAPRANVVCRGNVVELFTKDQTEQRRQSQNR